MADRSVVARLGLQVTGFLAGAAQASAASKKLASDIAKHARENEAAYNQVGGALVGIGVAALGAATVAGAAFVSFDRRMSAVQAATLATVDEMDELRAAAIQAGADTAFSASQAAQGIEELAKAGVSTSDIIGGGLTGALDLAAAGELDVATAAEIAATTLTQFGLAGEDVSVVADALAAGANKAQGSVQDLGLALSYAGVPAAALGLSVEETTGVLGLFANAGIVGEKAGTAFRSMLVSLQNPSAKAARLMSDLGIETFDANGEFIGMEAVAGVLSERLGGLTDQQRGAALATIFGNEALGAATALYNGGAPAVAQWTENVSEAGYASEVAATRLDNLSGDLQILRGSLETLLIGFGEGADGLREFTQDTTTVVNALADLPGPVKEAGLVIAGVGGAVAIVGGAAIIALPKLVAFNAALATMGPAGARAASAMGALGRAMGPISVGLVAIAAVGSIALNSYIDQKQAIDEYRESLDETTGAITENTREVARKRLLDSGAYEDAKRLGISLNTVTEAAVGNQEALDEVARATEGLGATSAQTGGLYGRWMEIAQETSIVAGEQDKAANNLNRTLGIHNEQVAAARQEQALLNEASDDSTRATEAWTGRLAGAAEAAGVTAGQADVLGDSIAGVGEEAMTAEDAISEMDAALDRLLGAELDVQEATDAVENKLAELAERAEDADGNVENLTGGITDNTQAARDNRAAMNEGIRAITDEARARAANGEQMPGIIARIRESREALIREAMARGASREEAEDYTAVLLDIPSEVLSTVEVQTGQALSRLGELERALGRIPTYRDIQMNVTRTGSNIAMADGGVITPAANGLMREPMIAPAGSNILWAEPETGGEAYIPLAASKRARSLALWQRTGELLGAAAGRNLTVSVKTDGTDGAERVASRVVRRVQEAESLRMAWAGEL